MTVVGTGEVEETVGYAGGIAACRRRQAALAPCDRTRGGDEGLPVSEQGNTYFLLFAFFSFHRVQDGREGSP